MDTNTTITTARDRIARALVERDAEVAAAAEAAHQAEVAFRDGGAYAPLSQARAELDDARARRDATSDALRGFDAAEAADAAAASETDAERFVGQTMSIVEPHLTRIEAIRFRCSIEIDLADGTFTDDRGHSAHLRAVGRLWSHMTGYASKPSAGDWDRLVEVDFLLGTDTVPGSEANPAKRVADQRAVVERAELALDTAAREDRAARMIDLDESRRILSLLIRAEARA